MARSRRERLRAQTFNEIKQTARYQMREHGAASISLRAIAREMGMSAPAIYRYFANYSELITSLIIDAFTSLADALEKADQRIVAAASDLNSAETHHNRLKTLGLTYRDWATKWPQDYLLIFGTPLPNYTAAVEQTEPATQRVYQSLITVLASAQNNGHLKSAESRTQSAPATAALQAKWQTTSSSELSPEVVQAAVAYLAMLEGLVSMELAQRFESVSAEIFPHMLDQQLTNLGL